MRRGGWSFTIRSLQDYFLPFRPAALRAAGLRPTARRVAAFVTFLRVVFLRDVFLRVAFLRVVLLRAAFLRVVLLRVPFLRVAPFRVAFLLTPLRAVFFLAAFFRPPVLFLDGAFLETGFSGELFLPRFVRLFFNPTTPAPECEIGSPVQR
jgi:hypothetical protein